MPHVAVLALLGKQTIVIAFNPGMVPTIIDQLRKIKLSD